MLKYRVRHEFSGRCVRVTIDADNPLDYEDDEVLLIALPSLLGREPADVPMDVLSDLMDEYSVDLLECDRQICPHCYGTGSTRNGKYNCDTCKGDGILKMEYNYDD